MSVVPGKEMQEPFKMTCLACDGSGVVKCRYCDGEGGKELRALTIAEMREEDGTSGMNSEEYLQKLEEDAYRHFNPEGESSWRTEDGFIILNMRLGKKRHDDYYDVPVPKTHKNALAWVLHLLHKPEYYNIRGFLFELEKAGLGGPTMWEQE